ncbi:hypothetical protein [Pseudomonas borbori]|uniref:hypothetical protein n=1 Tax=Pseudomonas borbori TaxID=289003 RepID=UPI001131B3A6|nr:hypothetical protein [Pseudomonas borbori]
MTAKLLQVNIPPPLPTLNQDALFRGSPRKRPVTAPRLFFAILMIVNKFDRRAANVPAEFI